MIEPMATTTVVKLISKDGCEFCIPLSCCRLSEVITSSELENLHKKMELKIKIIPASHYR